MKAAVMETTGVASSLVLSLSNGIKDALSGSRCTADRRYLA